MSNAILTPNSQASNSQIFNDQELSYKNISWCPTTVEHPFDKNVLNSCNNDDWVYLVGMEEDFLDEQALLLCPHSEEEWITWLPSYGETVIHIKNMCRIP